MPWLNRCISKTAEAIRCMPEYDPMSTQVMRRYFELLYDIEDLDKKQIMRRLNPKILDKDLLFPFQGGLPGIFGLLKTIRLALWCPGNQKQSNWLNSLGTQNFQGFCLEDFNPIWLLLGPENTPSCIL